MHKSLFGIVFSIIFIGQSTIAMEAISEHQRNETSATETKEIKPIEFNDLYDDAILKIIEQLITISKDPKEAVQNLSRFAQTSKRHAQLVDVVVPKILLQAAKIIFQKYDVDSILIKLQLFEDDKNFQSKMKTEFGKYLVRFLDFKNKNNHPSERPLLIKSIFNNLTLAKILIEIGVKINGNVLVTSQPTYERLFTWVKAGGLMYPEATKSIIDTYGEEAAHKILMMNTSTIKNMWGRCGYNHLIPAIECCLFKTVSELIKCNIDVNVYNTNGFDELTALEIAFKCKEATIDLVKKEK